MDHLLNYHIPDIIPTCLCNSNIFNCFDQDCNNCINKDLIYSYCPFLQIITNNSNIKNRKFDLQKNYYVNMDGSTHNFNIFRNYLVRWQDVSNNYTKEASIIISLSLYNIIINNRIIIECMYYIYEPFLSNIITILKLTLDSSDYMYNLKKIFEEYFIHTPNENINIMYNWLDILENIKENNKN